MLIIGRGHRVILWVPAAMAARSSSRQRAILFSHSARLSPFFAYCLSDSLGIDLLGSRSERSTRQLRLEQFIQQIAPVCRGRLAICDGKLRDKVVHADGGYILEEICIPLLRGFDAGMTKKIADFQNVAS